MFGLAAFLLLALQPSLVAEDHAPIRIDSDHDLGLPDAVAGNGVRSGSGSADDPYVISNWRIASGIAPAIWISDTTAHVRVERLDVDVETSSFRNILVESADHVTVQDVVLSGEPAEIWVKDGSHIRLHRNVLERGDISTDGTSHVEATWNQLGFGEIRIGFRDAANISNNIVVAPPGDSVGIIAFRQEDEPAHLEIVENQLTLHGGSGIYVNPPTPGQLCHNLVRGSSSVGIVFTDERQLSDPMEVCHNVIEGVGGDGIALHYVGPVVLHNNTVRGGEHGILVRDSPATVRDNVLHDNRIGVLVTAHFLDDVPAPLFRANILLENDLPARVEGDRTVDMELNYWGSAENPRNHLEGAIDANPWCLDPSCDATSADAAVLSSPGVDPLGFAVAIAIVVGFSVARARTRVP